MLIKKVGKNRYRKATWWDFLKLHFYEIGTAVVGLAVVVMFFVLMGEIF